MSIIYSAVQSNVNIKIETTTTTNKEICFTWSLYFVKHNLILNGILVLQATVPEAPCLVTFKCGCQNYLLNLYNYGSFSFFIPLGLFKALVLLFEFCTQGLLFNQNGVSEDLKMDTVSVCVCVCHFIHSTLLCNKFVIIIY